MDNITTRLDTLSRFWATANIADSEVVSLSVNQGKITIHLYEPGFRSVVEQYGINLNDAERIRFQDRTHTTVKCDGIHITTISEAPA